MKHPRAWNRNHWILLLGALTIVATWLWYTRPVPLSQALEIDQATTPVEVWLIRETMVKNTAPDSGYRYLVLRLGDQVWDADMHTERTLEELLAQYAAALQRCQ